MGKEKFSFRLGFILIAAGCAIGIGNVYKFPIWTGAYGGAVFVVVYLLFLLLLGIPCMTTELAVGRGSQKSIASSFKELEKPGTKWHIWQYVGVAANYALMMCYTQIAGWFLSYAYYYANGKMLTFDSSEALFDHFINGVYTNLDLNLVCTAITVLVGLGVCALGLQKGVERITKVMMICLFGLLIGLCVYSLTLPGAKEGLEFYLIPSLKKANEVGWGTVLSTAMGQAFFTLSLGIGSIAIFGASMNKEKRILNESITIIALDTFVALAAGLFLFPAYFTFNPGTTITGSQAGPTFLFVTLSNVFNNMTGGRVLGTLFFIFMVFAAYSTVIAVMENIVNFWLEKTKFQRKSICIINILMFFVLCLPAIFSTCSFAGFDQFTILGKTMDGFEDYFVSNLALPVGCLIYCLFCVRDNGWGWENYLAEVNAGEGLKMPRWINPYMSYVLPSIIVVVMIMSIF